MVLKSLASILPVMVRSVMVDFSVAVKLVLKLAGTSICMVLDTVWLQQLSVKNNTVNTIIIVFMVY